MVSKEEIKRLADLARVMVEEKEAEELALEIDQILEYVGQVKEISGDVESFDTPLNVRGDGGVINVMREDENPNEPGAYREELIAEFPNKDGDYLKVKKIL